MMVSKFIKEHQVLLAGLLIALMIYFMYHRKSQPVPDSSAIVAAKDETIKVIQQSRENDRAHFDEIISMYERSDSLLRIKDKVQIIKNASIPVYIYSLSKDSLRAEGERTAKVQ